MRSSGAARGGAAGGAPPRGFSLLEVVIATALLSVLVLAALAVLTRSQAMQVDDALTASLESDGRRIVEQIAQELRQAGIATLVPEEPHRVTALSFRMIRGFVDGAVQWGPAIAYGFSYEAGELDNSRDDNGNGLVDEGTVVRSVEGGPGIVLGHHVQENGLAFTWNPDERTIEITLVMERLTSANGQVLRTFRTSVTIRN